MLNLILFHSLVETYEGLAGTLAQRNDSNTTDGVIINESGQNSAIIIEQVFRKSMIKVTCLYYVYPFQ